MLKNLQRGSELTEPIIIKKPKTRRKQRGRFRQLGLILFTVAVMAIITFVAYKYFFPQEEEFVLDYYTFTNVTRQDFLDSLSTSGIVKPEAILEIKAKTNAEVAQILVSEGEDVQAGDVIILLHSDNLYEVQSQARLDLEEANAALKDLIEDQNYEQLVTQRKVDEAKEQVENAKANLELQSMLYDYGTIARKDLEKAEKELIAAEQGLLQAQRDLETTLRTQQNALDKAVKTVTSAEQDLEIANDKIKGLTVTAPINGTLLALNVSKKTQVKELDLLVELADLSTQLVEIDISASQAERFQVGSSASVTVGQSQYPAVVSYIAPQARQSSDGKSLVRANLRLETDPINLRPFSTASVNIHLGIYEDSLCLPRGPYLTSGQQLFVYRIENGSAIRTDVQFGMLQGNHIQILGGLDYDDVVITSSYDQYRHRENIKILPEGGKKL